MTVHVLIPVFNRLPMTQVLIGQLRRQIVDEELAITVIDDGSTDGTDAYLRTQPDVQTLTGDGTLWWSGSIDLGLRHVLPAAEERDWVLLINNDTEVCPDYVQRLLDAARRHVPAAVGSMVRDAAPPYHVLSVGPRIDSWRLTVRDIGDVVGGAIMGNGVVVVDALSGRGVIYPVAALRSVGGLRPRWLPQYLGDYEVSLRVRAHGWRLLVAKDAVVYSSNDFGSSVRAGSLRDRFFSVRSPTYLPAQLAFWWQASGIIGRITLPIRLLVHFLRYRISARPKVSGQ